MRKALFFLLLGLSSPLLAVTAIGPAVGTIQNRNTLQAGATAYPEYLNVGGTGKVTIYDPGNLIQILSPNGFGGIFISDVAVGISGPDGSTGLLSDGGGWGMYSPDSSHFITSTNIKNYLIGDTQIQGNAESTSFTSDTYYFSTALNTYLNFTGSQVCLFVLGVQEQCWPAIVTASYLLLESGDFALLETGDKIILE